jgi:elongation factor P
MAKIAGNEIRPGTLIEYDGGLWISVKTQAVKPGKGGAYNQVELKNIVTGTKLNQRFRSDETVDEIYLEKKDYQFLYGMKVMVTSYEGRPLGVQMPQHVTMTVAEADPVMRGGTAAPSYKNAVLENGMKILVPPFIDAGAKVVVSTEDGTYVKRAEI